MSYQAEWNGRVVASSGAIQIVESNVYFPESSIKKEYFVESKTTSECSWKGHCNYYSLSVDGQTNKDAAWFYKDPKPAASNIAGHVAFWKGVKVSKM